MQVPSNGLQAGKLRKRESTHHTPESIRLPCLPNPCGHHCGHSGWLSSLYDSGALALGDISCTFLQTVPPSLHFQAYPMSSRWRLNRFPWPVGWRSFLRPQIWCNLKLGDYMWPSHFFPSNFRASWPPYVSPLTIGAVYPGLFVGGRFLLPHTSDCKNSRKVEDDHLKSGDDDPNMRRSVQRLREVLGPLY
jgi:hypothetical protein